MTDDWPTIRGASKPQSKWFGGACVARGKPPRTRFLGSMWGGSLGGHTVDEDFSEPLGVMKGPLWGDIALGQLGRTAAERADDRARARAAHVDAALADLGVRPRRQRIGFRCRASAEAAAWVRRHSRCSREARRTRSPDGALSRECATAPPAGPSSAVALKCGQSSIAAKAGSARRGDQSTSTPSKERRERNCAAAATSPFARKISDASAATSAASSLRPDRVKTSARYERPKLPRRKWRILEPVEVARVSKAFTDEQAKTVFLTLVLTGIRRSELQALRWRDVDLVENVLKIRDSKSEDGIRSIALSTTLAEELWQHRRRSRRGRPQPARGCATCGEVASDARTSPRS